MSKKSILDYKKELDANFQIFVNMLNQITQSYPLYKKHPNYKPYEDNYKENISSIKKVQDKILSIKRKLQQKNYVLSENLSILNKKYNSLEKDNDKLIKEKQSLYNSDSAAGGVFIDKMKIYRINFTQNLILLFLFLGGVCLFFYKLTNKNVSHLLKTSVSGIKNILKKTKTKVDNLKDDAIKKLDTGAISKGVKEVGKEVVKEINKIPDAEAIKKAHHESKNIPSNITDAELNKLLKANIK